MNETPVIRVALVTGAARGLGRAMALGLAQAGYRVAACGLADSDQELRALAGEAHALGRGDLQTFHVDISDPESCRAAVHAVLRKFGAVDILVNNAGIGMEQITAHIHDNPFKFYEIDESFWLRVVNVNLIGTFRMTKLVVPLQVQRGWGRIINVTTGLGTMVKAGFSPYGPSKAGVEAATAIWAKELANTGVTANVLIPGGPADTRMIPVEDVGDRTSLVPPKAMVAPLLHLVSPAADATTGKRFIAKLWRSELPPGEAAALASAPAAWN